MVIRSALTVALVGAVFGLSAQSASAADLADMPIVDAYGWSGWHAGANVGGAFSDNKMDASTNAVFPDNLLNSTIGASTLDVEPSGMLVGGQIGYDWQQSGFIWGFEGDFNFGSVSGDATACANLSPDCATFGFLSADQNLEFLSTVRGRLGIAADNYLLYVTGGLAIGGIDTNATLQNAPGDNWVVSRSDTKAGWTVGGGGALALGSGASVGLEYLYVDLGDTTLTNNGSLFGTEPVSFKFDHQYHIARVKLNFQF